MYAENRLVSVTITATGHRSEFGYDGFGRRVCIRELDPDATQTLQVSSDKKYLWDGVQIAEERSTDGGTVLKRFYDQGFVDSDGTVLFYTQDHLGSIRELTDSQQVVRARYDYDPYGRMTKVSGDRDSALGYAGYLWHAQSGLNLTWYRAYDPNLGRWLSRDPIEEAGGINLYAYVLNNPIYLKDELGLDAGMTTFRIPTQPTIYSPDPRKVYPSNPKDPVDYYEIISIDPCTGIVIYTIHYKKGKGPVPIWPDPAADRRS